MKFDDGKSRLTNRLSTGSADFNLNSLPSVPESPGCPELLIEWS